MENIEKYNSHMKHGEYVCLIGIPEGERKENGAAATYEEINSQNFSKYDARHHL